MTRTERDVTGQTLLARRSSWWWSGYLPRLTNLSPPVVAVVGGVGILLFAALGAAYAMAKDDGPVPSWFRALPVALNGEWTVPAFYSALLLLLAGFLSLHASGVVVAGSRYMPLVALGVLFSYMSVDEVLAVHERLENVVDMAWWKLYAPVATFAGLCALLVLRRLWDHVLVRCALLGGGGCWLIAQAIETQQYDGAELIHRWTILPEEVLEMTGSLLFVLAMLLIVRLPWSGGAGRAGTPNSAARQG